MRNARTLRGADRLDVAKLKIAVEGAGGACREVLSRTPDSQPIRSWPSYQMNMRYAGQNWPLTFDIQNQPGRSGISLSWTRPSGRRRWRRSTHATWRNSATCAKVRLPEITGVRLVTYVDTPSPRVNGGHRAPTVAAKAARTRRANLGQGYRETPVFRAADLAPDHEVIGPAIIEETFTTIVVYPGWKAHVDDAGDYELTRVRTRRG